MADPILYGADYSTYVRTTRMALAAKQQSYELVSVDVFSGQTGAPEHLARQPFGKIPAFHHDDVRLYETMAILRYIDLAFDGPSLEPAGAVAAARAIQLAQVAFNYAYTPIVWDMFVAGVALPSMGKPRDEEKVAAGAAEARKVCGVINGLLGSESYAVGDAPSLADFALAPIVEYVSVCPEADQALADAPKLRAWWDRFKETDLAKSTRPGVLG